MAGLKANRITIYIRPKRDKDIRNILEGVDEGDVSEFIRELLRDGIKFRQGGQAVARSVEPPYSTAERAVTKPDFSGIALSRGTVSDEELNARLDDL